MISIFAAGALRLEPECRCPRLPSISMGFTALKTVLRRLGLMNQHHCLRFEIPRDQSRSEKAARNRFCGREPGNPRTTPGATCPTTRGRQFASKMERTPELAGAAYHEISSRKYSGGVIFH